MASEKEKEYVTGSVVSLVLVLIFIAFTILIPILGIFDQFSNLFYFLRFPSDNTRYFWHGVQLSTIFRPYDQIAGLTPILIDPDTGVATYLQHQDAWIFVLVMVWLFPFVILGIGGAILHSLPMFLVIFKKESPKLLKSLASKKIGIFISIIGIGIEWILFVIYWVIRLVDQPHFGGFPLLGLILGLIALYFSQVIWEAKRNWAWELNRSFSSFVFYVLVIGVIIYCVFPFLWSLILSLKDPGRAVAEATLEYLPSNPTVQNYIDVFEITPFHLNILNSLILASFTTVLCVLTGAFGAYVIARFQFTAKRVILSAILSMTMFPALVILVPLYLEYIFVDDVFGIKMLNSLPGILIPYLTFNLPLTLFLLQNFFEEIPSELIKAARVDGASNFQVFRKVVFPLAVPGIFTTGILVFIAAWNEFLFASLLLSRKETWTIPVIMASFEGIGRVQGFVAELLLSAATVIVTLPLIVLVLIFQRQIISGITAGAVKG